MTTATPTLRPMDISDLLDRTVAHYRQHLVPLLGIHAIAYAPADQLTTRSINQYLELKSRSFL